MGRSRLCWLTYELNEVDANVAVLRPTCGAACLNAVIKYCIWPRGQRLRVGGGAGATTIHTSVLML